MNIEDIKLQLDELQHVLDTMIENEFVFEDDNEGFDDLVRINTGWEWNINEDDTDTDDFDECYLYSIQKNFEYLNICNGLKDVEDTLCKLIESDILYLISLGEYVGVVEDDNGISVLKRSRFFSINPEVFSCYNFEIL